MTWQWVRRATRSAGASQGSVQPTRLSISDLTSEALAGLSQRPARTVLTMFGTVLGVGSFVAVLGLTATATGQVSSAFSEQSATQITVADAGGSLSASTGATVDSFPVDAEARLKALNGVRAAGIHWSVGAGPRDVTASLRPGAPVTQVPVTAATSGYLEAAGFKMADGAGFTDFTDAHPMAVAVLGATAARELAVTSSRGAPAVFINGVAFTVVGIAANSNRDPATAGTIYVPAATARHYFGKPLAYAPASILVRTDLGAADQIANEAPLALRPDAPDLIHATHPPSASPVRADVMASLNSVFIVLAAISLVVGAVSIANTTLVAVLERTSEIGLRRALGARPRHVAAQFLTESAAVGTLGGLVGTAVAIGTVVITAIARNWTAVLDPGLTLPAPLVGTVTGLLAGVYPALRAARVAPLEALRR